MNEQLKTNLRRLGMIILPLLFFCFCGIGRANDMYFVALKQSPGFHDSLFFKTAESAFHAMRLDDEMKATYSWVLVSYGAKSGFLFARHS